MMPASYVLKTSYYKEGLIEVDLNGRIYREYAVPGGQHHDFRELPNGNLLVASDSPDLSSVEDYVVEIDRATGEVVFPMCSRTNPSPSHKSMLAYHLKGRLLLFHSNYLNDHPTTLVP